LLTPGPAQIYYGDETARTLTPGGGATGDATLRSFMNFDDLNNPNSLASQTLTHFQKIGVFRREHIAVGAGKHTKLQDTPYTFKREYNKNGFEDQALVYTGNDNDFIGALDVFGIWPDGTELEDYFSGTIATVSGTVTFGASFGLVLIGESRSEVLGVDDVVSNSNFVKAWPNPFNDSFKVSFINTGIKVEDAQLEMYDLLGKRVVGNDQIHMEENVLDIRASYLQKGMYLMKITLNNKTHVVQVIKN